ncbi:MAG: SRPBCC family protein [Deltaproteobacteria bacterium]|nr:SRPBCC family protein [Deltaproteobacteria bacterium]
MIWLGMALAAVTALVLGLSRFATLSENWGATAEEVAATLPGDEWLDDGPPVRVRMTRAVQIEVPAEQVWPWIAQMGRGAGWYSYDRLDNGGRDSARHIVTWVPEPRPGDATTIGYLRHLEPGRELAWWIGGTRFLASRFRGVMLYRVTGDADRCRLLVRIQSDIAGPIARFAGWLFRSIDGFMARRQMVGIRQRAERYGDRSEDDERPETGARDQYQLYQVIYASGVQAGVPGRSDAVEWRRAAVADGVVEPLPF